MGAFFLAKKDQQSFYLHLPKPPDYCESFFISNVKLVNGYNPFGIMYDVDALMVSLVGGIPTINGYSGNTPHGWDLGGKFDLKYFEAVNVWILSNNLRSICAFDAETLKFTKFLPYK